jgi:hypothetical protein
LSFLFRGGPLFLLNGLEGADGREDVSSFRFFTAGDGEGCVERGMLGTRGKQIGRVEGLGIRGRSWGNLRGRFLRWWWLWFVACGRAGGEIKQGAFDP